jgi:hypothetical protein
MPQGRIWGTATGALSVGFRFKKKRFLENDFRKEEMLV